MRPVRIFSPIILFLFILFTLPTNVHASDIGGLVGFASFAVLLMSFLLLGLIAHIIMIATGAYARKWNLYFGLFALALLAVMGVYAFAIVLFSSFDWTLIYILFWSVMVAIPLYQHRVNSVHLYEDRRYFKWTLGTSVLFLTVMAYFLISPNVTELYQTPLEINTAQSKIKSVHDNKKKIRAQLLEEKKAKNLKNKKKIETH
jgi:hypothetical protein